MEIVNKTNFEHRVPLISEIIVMVIFLLSQFCGPHTPVKWLNLGQGFIFLLTSEKNIICKTSLLSTYEKINIRKWGKYNCTYSVYSKDWNKRMVCNKHTGGKILQKTINVVSEISILEDNK